MARERKIGFMIVISVLLMLLQTASATPNGPSAKVHVCRFAPGEGAWKGSCGQMDEENPVLIIHSSKTITTGRWRKDSEPSSVWAGDMKYSDGAVPIEIEVYSNGRGVLRSEDDGWFPINQSKVSDRVLQFEIDFGNEVPASDLDREILKRAAAILSTEAVWNRADTRECSPADVKWSIYCAMEEATIEVTGGFHHRRPALEVVREIVDERSAGKPYKHRLMDYNNDPTTRFADVQTLFAEALHRIE
jgi:hypothetical protein